MKYKGPDFLGIGAQRSGSTWLWKQLRQHPEILMPGMKEIHYFDDHGNSLPHVLNIILNGKNKQKSRNRLKYSGEESFYWKMRFFLLPRNDKWYTSFFMHEPRRTSGEITPEYAILNEKIIERVYNLNPKMKIVFLLRNPIHRALSAYALFHQLSTPEALYQRTMSKWTTKFENNIDRFCHSKKELLSFPDHLVDRDQRFELQRIRDKLIKGMAVGHQLPHLTLEEFQLFFFPYTISKKGNYIKSLKNWGKYFPDEQIYIDYFENVVNHPKLLLRNVFSFLGVAPAFETEGVHRKENVVPDCIAPGEKLTRMIAMSHLPIIEDIHANLGNDITHSWLEEAKTMLLS